MEDKITMADFEALADCVIDGDIEDIGELTQEAVDEGTKPLDIINEGLMVGMNVVGERFKAGEVYIPEVLMSARAMATAMEIVKPLLVGDEVEEKGKIMLGTVKGDLHDIGKKLVGMMIEGAGYEVVDLGVDVSAEQFAEAVAKEKPDVLGMSALLTTTMLAMKDTIETLKEKGLRDTVKIMVGGAPVTPDFSDEIGADGWGSDAVTGKDLVVSLIEGK
jgi:5-methyltetrahydrofolate--homocysteine methyltransferase